jgi:predicted methyltransferase MtxX (methanogen marker protein 4)
MSAITKARYLTALQQQVNKVAQVMETSQTLLDLYTDRGYDVNHGGIDPIADADVAALGITANQVYFVTQLLGQLSAFFTANSNANQTIVNAVRNDK